MKILLSTLSFVLVFGSSSITRAAIAYTDPPGGWDYLYDGSSDTAGAANSGFSSLDGSWSHDNGSDAWDGSQIGGALASGNAPGGVMSIDGYLRIQDTGDPRNDYPDPGNRKIYLGHDISAEGASDTVLNEGVTLTFRVRLPTDGTLDDLYPSGAWPALGNGYLIHDSGKGPIGIKQNSGGVISFALATSDDTTGLATGLLMNSLDGTANSGNVDSGEGTPNFITLDPTQWHEFWVIIVGDTSGGGTHRVTIYQDGDVIPMVFHVTAGTGSDFSVGYIAMGEGSTGQSGAIDVDFFGYKKGEIVPPGSEMNRPPQIENLNPANGFMFHPSGNGLSFTVTTLSPNTVAAADIHLTLNGADVTAALVIGGTPTSRTVQYNGLTPNTFYTGHISVSDGEARTTDRDITFDTLDGTTMVIEAEDYNYGVDGGGNPVEGVCGPGDPSPSPSHGGGFQDNPPPSGFTFPGLMQVNGSGVGYLDLIGVPGTDFSDTTMISGGPALNSYRTCDPVGVQETTDVARQKYIDVDLDDNYDLQVHNMQPNEWLNYTRTFPAGNFRIYLRVSSSADQQLNLSRVTSDATQPNQMTQILGVFNTSNSGASHRYTPLTDGLSTNPIVMSFSGQSTLRLTALAANNNIRPNFMVLVPTSDSSTFLGPIIIARSPEADAQFVRPDASISLTISNRNSSLDTASIQLLLDNVDVTGNAVITPTAFGGTVSYQPPASFAIGSTHAVRVIYGDNSAPKVFLTNDWSFSVITAMAADANLNYQAPAGGWYYTYTGDGDAGSPRRATPVIPALDGTWDHENGSDEWNGDGLTPGDGAVGGVESQNGVLTIVDALTAGGANDNRKLWFAHNTAQEGVTDSRLLDNGVTISFRARLTPSSPELTTPDGHVIINSGKGQFGISQNDPDSQVGFSLTREMEDVAADTLLTLPQAGLVMNRLAGPTPDSPQAADVDTQATNGTLNLVPLDPTVFHEFWITIVANDATTGNGTHDVNVYVDGSTTPMTFQVTAGNGLEYGGQNSLFLGCSATAATTGFDVDFFSYAPGVLIPLEKELITLGGARRVGNDFSFSFATKAGVNYTIQYKDNLNAATWTDDGVIAGDGTAKTVLRMVAGDTRYYRIIK